MSCCFNGVSNAERLFGPAPERQRQAANLQWLQCLSFENKARQQPRLNWRKLLLLQHFFVEQTTVEPSLIFDEPTAKTVASDLESR